MTTNTRQENALKRKISAFYGLLNRKELEPCFRMIDPTVRHDSGSVTLLQYADSLSRFLNHFGEVRIRRIDVQLHLGESNKLYRNRDFAVGQTVWEDQTGEEHTFQERWVRDGKTWYTRSTGFVTPGTKIETVRTKQMTTSEGLTFEAVDLEERKKSVPANQRDKKKIKQT